MKTSSQDSYYDQNDTIASFSYDTSIGLISNGPGILQIPQSNINGLCSDNDFATFENAQELSTCNRVVSTVSVSAFGEQCIKAHSVQHYIANSYIAK